jgi:hypothetical protein
MAKKWSVTYGPFEDETIELVAKSMGYGQSLVRPETMTPSEFVSKKMHEQQTNILSQAQIEVSKKDLMAQVKAVEEGVKKEVAELIKITVEEVDGKDASVPNP